MVEEINIPEGYKKTEIGILPKEWEIFSINKLVENNIIEKPLDGNHGNIHPKSKDYVSYGIPFIMANSVHDGMVDLNNCNFIRKEQADHLQKGFSLAGDVLLTHKGTVGNVTIVGNISTSYIMLTPQVTYYRVKDKNKIINIFIRYFFESAKFQAILQSLAGGGTRSYIGITKQKQLPFVLPPLPEQKAIAQSLSDVDALITECDRIITKKRNTKQGTMQQLLTGKKRLPGFSGEWEIKKFRECFEFLSTGINSRSDLSKYGNVGYIHYGDIHTQWNLILDCDKDNIPLIDKEKVKGLPILKDGDLIIADASEDYEGVGISIEVKNIRHREVVAGLHTLLLRADNQVIADGFKTFITSMQYVKQSLQKIATGISVYGISKTNLKNVNILLPPTIEEQKAITQILSDMDAEIAALEQKRDKYKVIKQGMMQELLTGKTRLNRDYED